MTIFNSPSVNQLCIDTEVHHDNFKCRTKLVIDLYRKMLLEYFYEIVLF